MTAPSEYLRCAWCGSNVERGLFVCLGCNADVVYGATRRELRAAFVLGFFFGPALTAFLYPLLEVQFPQLRLRGGNWFAYGILSAPGMAVAWAVLRWWWHRGKIRFFRRGRGNL